jgi:glycosyltransferase involved in cell wall biosynthesis
MKIIAACRTRNEENNIERFCLAYGSFCDEIIIVDGGSEDNTIEIARSMSNTHVYDFEEKVYGNNDLWRNPHGKHINMCISKAEEHGADWIIFDDCDDVPNLELQKNARKILEEAEEEAVSAYRLYIYGKNHYFPKLNVPGQSLWSWNTHKVQIWADEDDPWKHHISYPNWILKLEFPLCLLHYFAQTPEETNKKLDFYVRSGQHPTLEHPLDVHGPLEKLPEFAKWK